MSRASHTATVGFPTGITLPGTVGSAAPHADARDAPARTLRTAVVLVLLAVLTAFGVVALPAPAQAASAGAGFGTWAPLSPHGWHGSMIVDGVHTYCILPGAPAPTGPSVDRGVDGAAAGLSAQQLTGVNLLVTRYGQTDDPVQAAAVGWAVKALANWDETLHHFGYSGDSLAGAIDWTFSSLAPAHNAEVQRLAVAYYDEARAVSAGVVAASGSISITADSADQSRGSLRVEATTAATGTISLVNATFVENGTSTLSDAATGVDYPIVAEAPQLGHPFEVSATGRFSVEQVAAVRHFTTDGGQDTAGPAGVLEFEVAGADAFPRVVPVPSISSRAEPTVTTGHPASDTIIVGAPVPARGLVVASSLFRAVDGVAAADTCTAQNLVWQSEPVVVAEPGEHTVTSPPITEAATYYWQESAADATGSVVHTGLCGVENETTRVLDSPGESTAAPVLAAPVLAATGAPLDAMRAPAGIAVVCVTAGATLLLLRRRRYDACAAIG